MIIRICRWAWSKMTGASQKESAGSALSYRHPTTVQGRWPPHVPDPKPQHHCPSAPHECHCDLKSVSVKKGERLTQLELDYIQADQCPDCKGLGFISGPMGGLSQNFYCAVRMCSSRFNSMGPFGIERISDASPGYGGEDARSYQ